MIQHDFWVSKTVFKATSVNTQKYKNSYCLKVKGDLKNFLMSQQNQRKKMTLYKSWCHIKNPVETEIDNTKQLITQKSFNIFSESKQITEKFLPINHRKQIISEKPKSIMNLTNMRKTQMPQPLSSEFQKLKLPSTSFNKKLYLKEAHKQQQQYVTDFQSIDFEKLNHTRIWKVMKSFTKLKSNVLILQTNGIFDDWAMSFDKNRVEELKKQYVTILQNIQKEYYVVFLCSKSYFVKLEKFFLSFKPDLIYVIDKRQENLFIDCRPIELEFQDITVNKTIFLTNFNGPKLPKKPQKVNTHFFTNKFPVFNKPNFQIYFIKNQTFSQQNQMNLFYSFLNHEPYLFAQSAMQSYVRESLYRLQKKKSKKDYLQNIQKAKKPEQNYCYNVQQFADEVYREYQLKQLHRNVPVFYTSICDIVLRNESFFQQKKKLFSPKLPKYQFNFDEHSEEFNYFKKIEPLIYVYKE